MVLKVCVICGDEFEGHFNSKSCSDECRAQHRRNLNQRPEAKRKQKLYDSTPERIRKKRIARRKYLNTHKGKEQNRLNAAQWRSNPKNREHHRVYMKNYVRSDDGRNRDKSRSKEYRSRPEVKRHTRQQKKEYRSRPEVRQREKQRQKTYYQRSEVKLQKRLMKQKRRTEEMGLPYRFSREQWDHALNYFNGCCAVCGRQLKDLFGTHTAAQDHWIPLSYNGEENPGTVATNIIPLCHGENGCNNSKGATMPDVWLRLEYSERKARQIERRIQEYFDHVKDRQS